MNPKDKRELAMVFADMMDYVEAHAETCEESGNKDQAANFLRHLLARAKAIQKKVAKVIRVDKSIA